MTSVRVLNRLDGAEQVLTRLLHSGFAGSAFAATITRELTPNFLRWKYSPPAGHSMVATVERSGQVVSMVSASPLWVQDRLLGRRRAWQIGDIVTAPTHRGQGLFQECLATLCDALPAGDIIICFPNGNSRSALLKQDFAPVVDLCYSARPAFWWRRASPARISAPLSYSGDLLNAGSHDLHVIRDAAYLNWRYLDCPSRSYALLTDGPASDPAGILVFRRFSDALPIAVVMDLHGSHQVVKRLLGHLDDEARRQRLLAIMTIGTIPEGVNRFGLLPIPMVLQPKRMLLVARLAGASASRSAEEARRPWHLQVGDWDGL